MKGMIEVWGEVWSSYKSFDIKYGGMAYRGRGKYGCDDL
jgi:hypothetical protein